MTIQQDLVGRARQLLASGSEGTARSIATQALDELATKRATNFDWSVEKQTLSETESALNGFGVLQPYLNDPEIEEIWINKPSQIYFARHGQTHVVDLELDASQLQTFVQRLLRNSNRRVDRISPFADSSLEDGSRLHVVIPEITASHWAINIRKFRNEYKTLAQLLAANMVDQKQADFLTSSVVAGKNVLISGPTQAGKTTLLSALLNELPSSSRLITCEETYEIRCSLEDWVAMQTRQPNLEGHGEIPLRRLVKEALRMRPDRLVIGEVREAESFDLLIAMNSGIPGLCTLHANSAQAALQKLSTLPLLAGPNITADFVTATIATSLDYVVHLGLDAGIRRVKEICKVENSTAGLIAKAVKL